MMKEIAVQYLNRQLDEGVILTALATDHSIRVFKTLDLIACLERNADNTLLRNHDGIRLKPLSDNSNSLPIRALYNKAVCSFHISDNHSAACEEATANYFDGIVTGGNTDCPWDVITKSGVKIQVKGVGGLME